MPSHLFRYCLISDGTSDRALLSPVRWLLKRLLPAGIGLIENHAAPGDLRGFSGLSGRIRRASYLYPSDMILVHRDAERIAWEERREEIRRETEVAGADLLDIVVPIVPVRMSEAWLFLDEQAIRRASGNPHGRVELGLPGIREVESLVDPKERLHATLRTATEKTGRRLEKMKGSQLAARLPDLIVDFDPLLQLPSFQHLNTRMQAVIDHFVAT